MNTLTIRGCDAALAQALKTASKARGLSVNKLVIDTLETAFKSKESVRFHDDLTYLAGTWSHAEALEFETALSSFDTVNPEDWE